jgi:hypothetical protein
MTKRLIQLLLVLGLVLLPSIAHAQTQQVFPRIRLTFGGSATASTIDTGGWWIIRTASVTPAVSDAGTMRVYFNGTNWLISENGAAYHLMGPTLPASVFTSTGAFQTQTANTVFAGPTTGAAAVPVFRALVTGDIPALPYVSTTTTQTANTGLFGPATGAAAAPTFRLLVAADIPANTISFSHWTAQCAANEIPKRNAGNTAWVCAADNTSPGGTAWVTAGNTSITGGLLGTTDANAWSLVAGSATPVATFATTGIPSWFQDQVLYTTANAAATATTTVRPSTATVWRGNYWNGTVSTNYQMSANFVVDTTTPAGHWSLRNNAGTTVFQVDDGGNASANGSVTAGNYVGGSGYFYTNTRTSPGLSTTGNGRIYMDSGTNRFLISENGGAYQNLTGQGPSNWCVPDISTAQFPATANAYYVTVSDHMALEYADGAVNSAYWLCTLPTSYDNTDFNVAINWATAQTTGNVVWGVNIEKQDGLTVTNAFGVTAGNGNTQVTSTVAVNATTQVMSQTTIAYTRANSGTPVALNTIRLRLQRIGNSGSDTMSGTLQVYSVFIRK